MYELDALKAACLGTSIMLAEYGILMLGRWIGLGITLGLVRVLIEERGHCIDSDMMDIYK